ncbi:hypothetical protein VM98_38520, partial [Streptomyces rubellomurinus subsp. indigoferus]
DAAVRDTVTTLTWRGADVRALVITATEVGTGSARAALADRLHQEVGENGVPAGVVSLLAPEQAPHPVHPAMPAGLAATALLVQALGDAEVRSPLWCVTRGAVA